MKRLPAIFYILLPVVILAIGFLLYNNSTTDSRPVEVKPIEDTQITEVKLPKGKQIIEEDMNVAYRPGNVSALGGNNPNNEKNNGTTNNAEESRSDWLKKKYKNLLVFHVDDSMEVNKYKLAVLILARDESVEKMKIEVLEESNARDEKLKTDTTMDFGSKMRARLIPFEDSDNFEIEPLGDDEQSFRADRKKIIWQWKVKPMKEGKYELKLSVQIIEKDGEKVSLPAKNIPIVIVAKKETTMTKVKDFFSTKYEWIITAILLPVFIAWFTTTRRKRQMNKLQDNPPV